MSFWEKALFDQNWPKSLIWKKLRHIFEKVESLDIQNTSNEGIWAQKTSNSMDGIKSAKLAISDLALLIPCMEFKLFCPKITSLEVFWKCHYYTFSKFCLSFFQIKDLGQFRSKSAFSQKDTYLAFSFLFPSVLLSC